MQTDEYPENWPEIAQVVKDAAGWCCEHCGHPHDRDSGHVLTVHHLDGVKSNCEGWNLVALCQRCHLHLQAKLMPGQLIMPFAREEWMVERGVGMP